MTQTRQQLRRDPNRTYGLIAVVALVLAAAVFFISYNALKGLPGQSRYTVWINVPDAAHLGPTDEVRIAGLRVGQVSEVTARTPAGRHPYAHIKLLLDRDAAPLTSTARVSVQSGSVLGASYVDIDPGAGGTDVADGGELPLSRSGDATQLTDLLDIFNRSTARNVQGFLAQSSAGLAGRGAALNATIASFATLLPPFSRVARALSEPATRLGPFIAAADRATAGLAAASVPLADLMGAGARTFTALDQERVALGAALDAAPGAERATTAALRHVQPGLASAARVFEALRPAAPLLPGALRQANAALADGTPALRRLPAFGVALTGALRDVRMLAQRPSTDGAVRKVTELFTSSAPLFTVLGDAQIGCNLLGLWSDNFATDFGRVGAGEGPALANLQVTTIGASGESVQNKTPAPDLATNQYANNNRQECESGNEPFTGKRVLTNPAGLQSRRTHDTSPPTGVDAHATDAGLLAPEPR